MLEAYGQAGPTDDFVRYDRSTVGCSQGSQADDLLSQSQVIDGKPGIEPTHAVGNEVDRMITGVVADKLGQFANYL
jgi:hypothetical protein